MTPFVLPAGVTRRGVQILASRPGGALHVSGSVIVVCGHGRVKRRVKDLEVDLRSERPEVCVCCENLYARPDDVLGGVCPWCASGATGGLSDRGDLPG